MLWRSAVIDLKAAKAELELQQDDLPDSVLDLIGYLITEVETLRARVDNVVEAGEIVCEALAELKAKKWEVQHTDTMNEIVQLGFALASAEARAEAAEEALQERGDSWVV